VAIDIYNDPGAERRGEIIRRVNQALPGGETIRPGKALCLTEDNRVVEADDPEAAFVLVGEHGTLPADIAKELGIEEYQRTKEEQAEADARIAAGKGNVGIPPSAAAEAAQAEPITPAAEAVINASDPRGLTTVDEKGAVINSSATEDEPAEPEPVMAEEKPAEPEKPAAEEKPAGKSAKPGR